MKLTLGHKTDPGPRKGGNEDALLSVIPEENSETAVLVVADGMGGAKAGEQASQEAIRIIYHYLLERDLPTPQDAAERLLQAVTAANTSIHHKGLTIPEMEGMGCTVVVALILDDRYWIASVGDSRAYLIRGTQVRQLTVDHTWVSQQVRNGILTQEQANRHSLRHVLDRALGADMTIEVDIFPYDYLEPGDMLLLCTDGLYGVLGEAELAEVAANYAAQEAAEELVRRALEAQTRDNVSAVVLYADE